MAKVEIIKELVEEIEKKFGGRSRDIVALMRNLENNPHKGDIVGVVGGILVKELKYEGFRFYFIVDGGKLRFFSKEQLSELLIRFVRMSNKKEQQKTIDEIKVILRSIGEEGF